jgi:hypothetical protein
MAWSENWEMTIMELENSIGKKYKVTRRLPALSVAETRVFRSKEDAKQQLDLWMQEAGPSSSPG